MSKGTVSAIFVLILVGTLLFSKQVSSEYISGTNQISAHLMTAYENVTTHEGDLIINGTQAFLIENCTYIQNGSIYVRDRAKLAVKNATLMLAMQYNGQHTINVEDHAAVEVDTSRIQTEDKPGDIWLSDLWLIEYATVNVSSSKLENVGISSRGNSHVTIENSTFFELTMTDASQVLVDSSTGTWVVNLFFYFQQTAHLDGLRAGYHENWNLHRNETVQNVLYDLTVRNSVVVWALWVTNDSRVDISNCEIERFRIALRNETDIKNVRAGYHTEWSSDSILLRNSYVKEWMVDIYDTRVTVENSELALGAEGNFSLSIVNSSIYWFPIAYASSATVELDETVFTYYSTIIESNVYVYGNVTFSLQTFSFFSSNFTRNYNIIVTDADNEPVENVELTLFNQDYTVVWNSTADNIGGANFNLTFSDGNYTDILCLKARSHGLYSAVSTSLLSSAPVAMSLTMLGDLNNDGRVNILDIAAVAMAYCSRPGDIRWNPCLDLDDDGHVSILDITMVAIKYGKTA